jgi:hypothetical protein
VAKPALIVGSHDDEHVQAVLAATLAADTVVLDAPALEQTPYLLDGTTLTFGERRLDLRRTHGWIRRLATPGYRPATVAGSRDAAIRGAWIALTVGLAAHPAVDWLTPYRRLVAAENKLRQAAVAAALGIATPRTVVTADASTIPAALGDTVVVKPLGAGHFTHHDGEARVVYAQPLRRDDPRLGALGGAPFLVQEPVPARRHLRVVTLQDRAWSCALDAAGLPLDWRADEDAHHSFTPAHEPAVEDAALALARRLGLGYSSQDWIDTGRGLVFLDLNPAGQWLFLPEPVSGDVTEQLAAHLHGAAIPAAR